MTRVLVADDHPAFRRGLELMLGGVDDVEIVGFAETGAQGRRTDRGARPRRRPHGPAHA